MDGKKKKRKIEDADQEENEDEKIEKFFALIKSSRELRERMAGSGEENKQKSDGDKPQAEAAASWNPTFRLEDFMDAPAPPAPPTGTEKAAEAGPSTEGKKQEGDDKGLDLNLSL